MRAIRITVDNSPSIALFNDGIVPDEPNGDCYFVDPEDAEGTNQILERGAFFDNYEFVDGSAGSEMVLKEIREI